ALHLRDVHDGAFLHAYRDWHVYLALEASRDSASLSLHRVSVGSWNLCVDQRGLDDKYDRYPAERGIGGNHYCIDRCAGIFVLEADKPPANRISSIVAIWKQLAKTFKAFYASTSTDR